MAFRPTHHEERQAPSVRNDVERARCSWTWQGSAGDTDPAESSTREYCTLYPRDARANGRANHRREITHDGLCAHQCSAGSSECAESVVRKMASHPAWVVQRNH